MSLLTQLTFNSLILSFNFNNGLSSKLKKRRLLIPNKFLRSSRMFCFTLSPSKNSDFIVGVMNFSVYLEIIS